MVYLAFKHIAPFMNWEAWNENNMSEVCAAETECGSGTCDHENSIPGKLFIKITEGTLFRQDLGNRADGHLDKYIKPHLVSFKRWLYYLKRFQRVYPEHFRLLFEAHLAITAGTGIAGSASQVSKKA